MERTVKEKEYRRVGAIDNCYKLNNHQIKVKKKKLN
jgi:hypothetical protein